MTGMSQVTRRIFFVALVADLCAALFLGLASEHFADGSREMLAGIFVVWVAVLIPMAASSVEILQRLRGRLLITRAELVCLVIGANFTLYVWTLLYVEQVLKRPWGVAGGIGIFLGAWTMTLLASVPALWSCFVVLNGERKKRRRS